MNLTTLNIFLQITDPLLSLHHGVVPLIQTQFDSLTDQLLCAGGDVAVVLADLTPQDFTELKDLEVRLAVGFHGLNYLARP